MTAPTENEISAQKDYLEGRKKHPRPQAMLWSDNPGILVDGAYIPEGLEVGQTSGFEFASNRLNQFIILSDDNRGPISFGKTRIERRERMINGRMRSFHIADKIDISTSWTNLPSRSFSSAPEFNPDGNATFLVDEVEDREGTFRPVKPFGSPYFQDQQYTTDGGAGGVELLDWYDNHPGPFWVYLSYDKYSNFKSLENPYGALPKYSQVIEMFFTDFQHTLNSRGTTHDRWDLSVSLEEV